MYRFQMNVMFTIFISNIKVGYVVTCMNKSVYYLHALSLSLSLSLSLASSFSPYPNLYPHLITVGIWMIGFFTASRPTPSTPLTHSYLKNPCKYALFVSVRSCFFVSCLSVLCCCATCCSSFILSPSFTVFLRPPSPSLLPSLPPSHPIPGISCLTQPSAARGAFPSPVLMDVRATATTAERKSARAPYRLVRVHTVHAYVHAQSFLFYPPSHPISSTSSPRPLYLVPPTSPFFSLLFLNFFSLSFSSYFLFFTTPSSSYLLTLSYIPTSSSHYSFFSYLRNVQ